MAAGRIMKHIGRRVFKSMTFPEFFDRHKSANSIIQDLQRLASILLLATLVLMSVLRMLFSSLPLRTLDLFWNTGPLPILGYQLGAISGGFLPSAPQKSGIKYV